MALPRELPRNMKNRMEERTNRPEHIELAITVENRKLGASGALQLLFAA